MTEGVGIEGGRPAMIDPDQEVSVSVSVEREVVMRRTHDEIAWDDPLAAANAGALATWEAYRWGYKVERVESIEYRGGVAGERDYLVEMAVTGAP